MSLPSCYLRVNGRECACVRGLHALAKKRQLPHTRKAHTWSGMNPFTQASLSRKGVSVEVLFFFPVSLAAFDRENVQSKKLNRWPHLRLIALVY